MIASFSGLRAGGNTGDFIINRKGGFINLAGIESPGLTASVAISEYAVELLSEFMELRAKSDFVAERRSVHWFRNLPIEEKNEIIKKHPEFAKIVCRCELVTEGEILDAIRSNPRATDIDGVKRRTRAGMGRCQGGFCAPYVMELIARENGVAFESVTKCGGESAMVISKTKGASV